MWKYSFWVLYVTVVVLGLVRGLFFSGEPNPTPSDFSQYYTAALVARSGDWSGLYPDPLPNGERNAGSMVSARPNLKYLELAGAQGVVPAFNFIQPPAVAVLYYPLGWFSYEQGKRFWRFLGNHAIFGMAIFSGLIARRLAGSQTPTIPEISTVAIVCVLNRMRGILWVGNVSPIVGFAIAAGIYLLLRNKLRSGTIWLGIAAVLKISPAVLFLPALLMRGARGVLPGLLMVMGLLLASLMITGVDPWVTYLTKIVPTLERPWLPAVDHPGCTSSIYGVAYYFTQQNPLPHGILIGLKAMSFAATGLVALLWCMKRESIATDDRVALAAFASATVVPLIFAPLAWPHYSFLVVVYTGWLLFEFFNRAGVERFLSGLVLLLLYTPTGWLLRFGDKLANASDYSHLPAYILMLALSLRILLKSGTASVSTSPAFSSVKAVEYAQG